MPTLPYGLAGGKRLEAIPSRNTRQMEGDRGDALTFVNDEQAMMVSNHDRFISYVFMSYSHSQENLDISSKTEKLTALISACTPLPAFVPAAAMVSERRNWSSCRGLELKCENVSAVAKIIHHKATSLK